MFAKNPYELIIESCSTECGTCDDMYEDDVEDELEDEMDDIEELEESIRYTAEMVPVIEHETYTGTNYLVEMDMLAKFMTGAGVTDVPKALDMIAECNGLERKYMALLIESDDVVAELIEEAKNEKRAKGKSKKLGVLDADKKLLKGLKLKGIKVVKKKGNGKGKKGKKK